MDLWEQWGFSDNEPRVGQLIGSEFFLSDFVNARLKRKMRRNPERRKKWKKQRRKSDKLLNMSLGFTGTRSNRSPDGFRQAQWMAEDDYIYRITIPIYPSRNPIPSHYTPITSKKNIQTYLSASSENQQWYIHGIHCYITLYPNEIIWHPIIPPWNPLLFDELHRQPRISSYQHFKSNYGAILFY